jgi:hypothetical protein
MWDAAKDARAVFDSYFESTARYVWPNQKNFTSKETQGVEKNLDLYDDTAPVNAKKYAAVLETLLTRRGTRWHRITASEEPLRKVARVRDYHDQVLDVLFREREAKQAGCYENLSQCYRSEGVLGNDCLFLDDRFDRVTKKRDGIRYRMEPLRDIWITRNWQGVVERVFRRYELSAENLLANFEPGRIPEKWHEKAKNKPLEMAELLMVVEPNPDYDPNNVYSKPFSEFNLMPTEKAVLRDLENGYDEMPFIFTSAERAPGEDYGRGIAMDLLPTIKTMNRMIRDMLRAAEKQADPPLLTADDGVLGVRRAVRLRAGGLTIGGMNRDGKRMVDPLYTGANIGITEALLQHFTAKLDRAFFVDLFTLLTERPQMTAAEILERASEKGVFVGPVVGSHQEQKLAPMVEREIGILARQGKLPPMPPELVEAGGLYVMEYETPAQQMQRAGEVRSISETIADLRALAELDPDALEVIDLRAAGRHIANLRGTPSKLLRSEAEVERRSKLRLAAAERENMLAQIPPAAAAAKDIAGAAAMAA